MATVKYFSGTQEIVALEYMKNATFAVCFPGVKGRRLDGFQMLVGVVNGEILPVERVITYKRFPSLHVCSAKCVNGKPNGVCECSCGGKNHGTGGIGKPMSQLLLAA